MKFQINEQTESNQWRSVRLGFNGKGPDRWPRMRMLRTYAPAGIRSDIWKGRVGYLRPRGLPTLHSPGFKDLCVCIYHGVDRSFLTFIFFLSLRVTSLLYLSKRCHCQAKQKLCLTFKNFNLRKRKAPNKKLLCTSDKLLSKPTKQQPIGNKSRQSVRLWQCE